jgi:hypothetical protein
VEIKIDTTVEDLVEFSMYYYEKYPFIRRQYWGSILTLPIVWAIAGVVVFTATQGIKYAIICWIASVVSGILNYMTFGKTMRKRLKKIYSEKLTGSTLGKHQIYIDNNSILEKSSTTDSRMDWSGVKEIYVDDRYAYFIFGSLAGCIIPRNGIIEGNFDDFVEKAKEYWGNALQS